MFPAAVVSDFTVRDHGSLVLVFPVSEAAEAWADEHVGNEETMTWCGGIVVEPRYVVDIIDGAVEAGFAVEFE